MVINKTNITFSIITVCSIVYGIYNSTFASYSDKTEEIANVIQSTRNYKFDIANQYYNKIDLANKEIIDKCEQLPNEMKVDCNKLIISDVLPSRDSVNQEYSKKNKVDESLPSRSNAESKWAWDNPLSISGSECEDYERSGKPLWVELHYTATSTWTQLKAILNGHKARFNSEYIGYHYVVNYWGEVYNTRADYCVAAADKENKNNWRYIQISFIGSDKPSSQQKEAIKFLILKLSKKYGFDINENTITSHHEEASYKSKNESIQYWFWSKKDFINYLLETPPNPHQIAANQSPKILRNWWNDPRVQYGYEISNGDMDFIRTIEAESKWHVSAVGDSWNSFGLCQFHKGFNPWLHNEYKLLKTDNEKVKFCYDYYLYAKSLPKGVGSRLHWFNVRNLPQNTKPFVIVKQ